MIIHTKLVLPSSWLTGCAGLLISPHIISPLWAWTWVSHMRYEISSIVMLELLGSHDESLIDWSHIDWHTKTRARFPLLSPLPAASILWSVVLSTSQWQRKPQVLSWLPSGAGCIGSNCLAFQPGFVVWLLSDWDLRIARIVGRLRERREDPELDCAGSLALLHDWHAGKTDGSSAGRCEADYYQSCTQFNAGSQDYTGTDWTNAIFISSKQSWHSDKVHLLFFLTEPLRSAPWKRTKVN